MASEIVIAAVIAALVQLFQAWTAVARAAGLSDEQIGKLLETEYARFLLTKKTPLPDPDKEG